MQKVVLGRTGLEVTRLGFGALEMRDVVETGVASRARSTPEWS